MERCAMEDAPHPERGCRIFPFGHGLRVSVGFVRSEGNARLFCRLEMQARERTRTTRETSLL